MEENSHGGTYRSADVLFYGLALSWSPRPISTPRGTASDPLPHLWGGCLCHSVPSAVVSNRKKLFLSRCLESMVVGCGYRRDRCAPPRGQTDKSTQQCSCPLSSALCSLLLLLSSVPLSSVLLFCSALCSLCPLLCWLSSVPLPVLFLLFYLLFLLRSSAV